MERATLQRRLRWLAGTVVETVAESPESRTIALSVPGWEGHRAGQHVDVRLTADDGYAVQRSYSIASAPEDPQVVLTVERLVDGEVSPYLVDELRIGDELKIRGPIGGYFVWDEDRNDPLLLVAGGPGLAPFRSMLRHHRAIGSDVPVRLLCSARSFSLLLYREELLMMAAYDHFDISVTLTREPSTTWNGYRRRIDEELLAEVAWQVEDQPLTYICGPSVFVEKAADSLVSLGHDPARILTERFGGSESGER